MMQIPSLVFLGFVTASSSPSFEAVQVPRRLPAEDSGFKRQCQINGPEGSGISWKFGVREEACHSETVRVVSNCGSSTASRDKAFTAHFEAKFVDGKCHCEDRITEKAMTPPFTPPSSVTDESAEHDCEPNLCWQLYEDLAKHMAKAYTVQNTFWKASDDCPVCGGDNPLQCDDVQLEIAYESTQKIANIVEQKKLYSAKLTDTLQHWTLVLPKPFIFRWLTPEEQEGQICSKPCRDKNGPGEWEKPRVCQRSQGESGAWESVSSAEECIGVGLSMPDKECNKNACRASWSTKLPPESSDEDPDDPPAAGWKPEVSDDDFEECEVPCEESDAPFRRLMTRNLEDDTDSEEDGHLLHADDGLHEMSEDWDMNDEWGDDHHDGQPKQSRTIYCLIEDGRQPSGWRNTEQSWCLQEIKKVPVYERPCDPPPPLCSETTSSIITTSTTRTSTLQTTSSSTTTAAPTTTKFMSTRTTTTTAMEATTTTHTEQNCDVYKVTYSSKYPTAYGKDDHEKEQWCTYEALVDGSFTSGCGTDKDGKAQWIQFEFEQKVTVRSIKVGGELKDWEKNTNGGVIQAHTDKTGLPGLEWENVVTVEGLNENVKIRDFPLFEPVTAQRWRFYCEEGKCNQDYAALSELSFTCFGRPVDSKATHCPWKEGPTDKNDVVLCADGTFVTDYKCVKGHHGQRIKCPPNSPHMCADKKCGGGDDHCCADNCDEYGGDRPCEDVTCSTYMCKKEGWIKKIRVEDEPASEDNCCEETCAVYKCIRPGFVLKTDVVLADLRDPREDKCCVDSVPTDDFDFDAETTLQEAAAAGVKVLQVASKDGFEVGREVVIDPGAEKMETHKIIRVIDPGSIYLQDALKLEHEKDARVLMLKATCASYTCSTHGWIKQEEVDNVHYKDESDCCEKTCEAIECETPTWVKRPNVERVTGPSESVCCEAPKATTTTTMVPDSEPSKATIVTTTTTKPITTTTTITATTTYVNPSEAAKCWMLLPTGCNQALSETSTPTQWFVDPQSPDAATCEQRQSVFNGYCSRTDAKRSWGSQPQAPQPRATTTTTITTTTTTIVREVKLYWVDAGCPGATRQDNVKGAYQNASLYHAGALCCSDSSEHPGKSTCLKKTFCHLSMEFEKAKRACDDPGQRLCTKQELRSKLCCGVDKDCDHWAVWTSTDESSDDGVRHDQGERTHAGLTAVTIVSAIGLSCLVTACSVAAYCYVGSRREWEL